jgi:GT2 family glycosyltransferase
MNTIWFICVNYNATKDTIRFIAQLDNCLASPSVKVIVVNNSSTRDGALIEYALSKKNVYLVTPDKNMGYLPGANYGYTWAKQQWALPDFVAVANVDLVFDGGELLKSIEKLTYDKTIGVYAPKIVSAITGRDQNPHIIDRPKRSLYKLHSLIYSSLFGYMLVSLTSNARRWLMSIFRTNVNARSPAGGHRRIYAPHGAFMLFTKAYFESGGDLDFKSFLFGEEIYVGEILRKINLQAVYVPEIGIVHDEHQSTSMVGLKRRAALTKQSSSYLVSEFFS